MGPHLVQPLEVSGARVSRRANIVHRCAEAGNVVGEVKAGWQEAGDKHLADLNGTRERRWSRNILIFQIPHIAPRSDRKSYPGYSCVENQTATSLQDQHGIDVLKKNKRTNW